MAAARRHTEDLQHRLRELYLGTGRVPAIFQLAMLAFDIAILAYFVAVSFVPDPAWRPIAGWVIALVLAADFAARFVIVVNPLRHLIDPVTIADAIVILSLLVPSAAPVLAFLRVLRTLRLVQSFHVLGRLRRVSPWARQNDEVLLALLHLTVFLFLISAVVYVAQARINPEIRNYLDALYFTVTSVTTTGFGDITLVGDLGRLIAILVMLSGVTLFIRLARALVSPSKVRFPCPSCGLERHDPDAVHCKSCGIVLNIPNEGEG